MCRCRKVYGTTLPDCRVDGPKLKSARDSAGQTGERKRVRDRLQQTNRHIDHADGWGSMSVNTAWNLDPLT